MLIQLKHVLNSESVRPAGFLGGAGPCVIFNIMSSNMFSIVIDLGSELIGMLFIQTLLLRRQNVFTVGPQRFCTNHDKDENLDEKSGSRG